MSGFSLCTNCAMMLAPNTGTCPRCGQPTLAATAESRLEAATQPELVCAANLHYVPDGGDICQCGHFRRAKGE